MYLIIAILGNIVDCSRITATTRIRYAPHRSLCQNQLKKYPNPKTFRPPNTKDFPCRINPAHIPDNVVLLDGKCSPEHNGVWYVGIRGYIHEARTEKHIMKYPKYINANFNTVMNVPDRRGTGSHCARCFERRVYGGRRGRGKNRSG